MIQQIEKYLSPAFDLILNVAANCQYALHTIQKRTCSVLHILVLSTQKMKHTEDKLRLGLYYFFKIFIKQNTPQQYTMYLTACGYI